MFEISCSFKETRQRTLYCGISVGFMNGLFNRLCWGPSWLESHAYVLHFRWGEFIRASFHNRQIYGYSFLPLFSAPSHFFSTQGKVYWFSFFFFLFLSFFLLSRPMCGKRDILGGRNKWRRSKGHNIVAVGWVGVSNPHPHLTAVPPTHETTKTLDFPLFNSPHGPMDRRTDWQSNGPTNWRMD